MSSSVPEEAILDKMSYQKRFSSSPAFLSDIDTFPVSELLYSKLASDDQEESPRLFNACRQSGFFSLGLSDTADGQSLLQDVDELFAISEELYRLPKLELEKYDHNPPQDLHR